MDIYKDHGYVVEAWDHCSLAFRMDGSYNKLRPTEDHVAWREICLAINCDLAVDHEGEISQVDYHDAPAHFAMACKLMEYYCWEQGIELKLSTWVHTDKEIEKLIGRTNIPAKREVQLKSDKVDFYRWLFKGAANRRYVST